MAATTTDRTAEYKGKPYRLLFLGATRFGRRAELAFTDGNKKFWVDAEDVRETTPAEPTPPAGVKSADVKIKREGEDIFRVTSPTGADVSVSLDLLRNRSQVLHRMLARYMIGQLTTATLTYPQMADLAACRIGTAPKPVVTPEPEPYHGDDGDDEPEEEPVDVKPVVNGHAGVNGEAKAVAEQTVVDTASGSDNRQKVGMGADAVERRLGRLNEVVKEVSGQMSMLIYDIPTSKNDECPNPSPMLWHFGFRLNLSCWVMPEKSLNAQRVQKLLAHWREHAIEVHIIPYAEHALAQLRAICREKLRLEIVRVHASLIERITSASTRLEVAQRELDVREKAGEEVPFQERDKADRSRDNAVRGIIKQAAESLAASVDCARAFDESDSVVDLLAALRNAIRGSQEAFNAEMHAKSSKGVAVRV